jgi:hypothetical protein
MHKFLIYLSIYFCLTSLPGMVTAPWALSPYPGDLNHRRSCSLCRWAKRKPETCKAEVNRYINSKLVHYVGHYTVSSVLLLSSQLLLGRAGVAQIVQWLSARNLVEFVRCQRFFFQCPQTASGAHPASTFIFTEGSLPKDKGTRTYPHSCLQCHS